jgi:LacI family transcriptional regulator
MDWGFKRHLEVYAGCQRYADEAGWACSIDPAPDRLLKGQCSPSAYDGILARATPQLAEAAKGARVPLVNVWLNSPAKKIPSVFPDFEATGAMAAEHLLGRGFRNFGYLGFLRDREFPLQLKGFRAIIGQEGLTCTTHRFARTGVTGKAPDWDDFMGRLEAWVDTWKPPIGIFVTHDVYCRYLIDVCRSKGLHISHDVGIVGCHNETVICDAPAPSLTSIDLGFAQIGYRAAALLDRLMDKKRPPTAPVLLPPPELVPRQTTDSFAVDDPMVAHALRFMVENCHRQIRVKQVAAAVATTRRTLERRVRAAVGLGIAEEIVRLRVEHAKRRLVETDASLKTVARDSGFRNADHLYKVFTRVESISPARYRDMRQQLFLQRNKHPSIAVP